MKDSIKTEKRILHHTYVGIAKSNYFISKAPSVFGEVKKIIDNVSPAYSFGYETIGKVYKQLYIGLGINYTIAKTRVTYTNFITPNILSGLVSTNIKHNYISFPLNIHWKILISNISSMFLFAGAESFKTLKYKEDKFATSVSIYKNDGSTENNYQIATQYNSESFSLFRILNLGLKFSFNENAKNRVTCGINYYLMKNSFALNNKANMYIGNKNFTLSNNLYFEGLKFTMGYIW